ncbi:uncharacterized protein I303_108197 [Kwoniella dejecticola CBS 10117]|uniref:Very-long-chain (3R)-3-hydroxyacyl-CoA dehydratase n=1 Tax=Kwoniella dejecticola CBS 10117 TaxID=1296121 RepID=A0AAJ8KWA2_9TREE
MTTTPFSSRSSSHQACQNINHLTPEFVVKVLSPAAPDNADTPSFHPQAQEKGNYTSTQSARAGSSASSTSLPSVAPPTLDQPGPATPNKDQPNHSTNEPSVTPIYSRFSPSASLANIRETLPLTPSSLNSKDHCPTTPSPSPGRKGKVPQSLKESQASRPARSHSITPKTDFTNRELDNMSAKAQSQAPAKERVEQEKERVARKGQDVKSGLIPIKIYLLAYNALSALLWANLLMITVTFMFTPRSTLQQTAGQSSFLTRVFTSSTSSSKIKPLNQLINHLSGSYDFKNLGWYTKYTQSLAVLEVVHTALGLVRSPLGTVFSQVFSRVWTVWGVVEAVPEVSHSSPLFTTMLFAWSFTEVIRYTYYFLNLLQIQSPILNWLRYTTFIPLYPLGASSEAFLAFSTLPPFSFFKPAISTFISNLPPKARELLLKTTLGRNILWSLAKSNVKQGVSTQSWGPLEVFRLVMFFVWWPSLYFLYTYMFKQRRKVLGKGRGKGKVVGGANKAR